MKRAFFAAAAALLLGACTVRQDISLQMGGAGTARLEASLHPVFMAYYNDLASGFVPSFDASRPRYFNEEAIRENFRRNAELQLVSLAATDSGRLSLEFRIKDISAAIINQNPAARNIISLSAAGGRETLTIRLDRENLESLLRFIPEADSPFARMLLPPTNANMSTDEYREHLAWALEDYAKDENIDEILMGSRVRLTVKTPAKIVSQKGGVIQNEKEVLFEIPVLRLLTPDGVLEYSVVY